MYKAFKYRIYPDAVQEELIQKTFGCCRFVYNTVLAWRKDLYETKEETVSCFDSIKYVNNVLKNEYPWLREPDKWALSNAVRNLDRAYQNFFRSIKKGEKAGYPKFKSRYDNHKSYTTNVSGAGAKNIDVNFDTNMVKLPKLSWVQASLHRRFDGVIKNATVSQTPSGKYFVSIIVEVPDPAPLPETDKSIGLDLGIKNLITTSDGDIFENPKTLAKYEEKLARLQRQLSRQQRGSNNYEKTRVKIAKTHEKISNIRRDNLHKISRKLVNENQLIVSETLAIQEMMHDNPVAKSICDASWYELTNQIGYKSGWAGRKYIKLDKKFASNRICSACGCMLEESIEPNKKVWVCPECGAEIDRNLNAAKNILAEGLSSLS